jgi:hypothetical protein
MFWSHLRLFNNSFHSTLHKTPNNHPLKVRRCTRPIQHINHALGNFMSPLSAGARTLGTTPTRAREFVDAALGLGDAHLNGTLRAARRRAVAAGVTTDGVTCPRTAGQRTGGRWGFGAVASEGGGFKWGILDNVDIDRTDGGS